MPIAAGTHLGPYEIVAPLGAGGMGEVYRARDAKLNRDVALKVLPELFASNVERVARFKREAQVLASLNHPNIAAIYGLEGQDGREGPERQPLALVLELVEGPTLAEVLHGRTAAESGLEMSDALPIARQIADALEAAQEQGIIHRDLKPANIKLRPDGTVKALDFGLAKMLETGAGGAAGAGGAGQAGGAGAARADMAQGLSPAMLTNSPTLTTPAMTMAGVILGTAAYMSPEQAKGRPADKRSDIWAFGCVLYEMLTGKRVFEAEDISDTLAAVLRSEPDWEALPARTPVAVRRLLKRCLAKDRTRRLSDAAAAKLDIDEGLSGASDDPVHTATRPRDRVAWIITASLAVVTAVAGTALIRKSQSTPPTRELRLDVVPPPGMAPDWVALSPSGNALAFIVGGDAGNQVAVRSLEDGTTRVFSETNGAVSPFWSPDGRSIAFGGRQGGLQRLELADGSVRTLAANAYSANGGAWNPEGVILFAPTAVSPLMKISSTSNDKAVAVTTLREGETGHVRPSFLPDGRHFLYHVRSGSAQVQGIYVGSLDGGEPKRLVGGESAMVSQGHMLFVRQAVMFAQPFDTNRLELTGEPFELARVRGVRAPSGDRPPPVSATPESGTIAFLPPTTTPEPTLVWFDRLGQEIGRVDIGAPDFNNPELSRDDRYLAMRRNVNGNPDIWVFDFARKVWLRMTTGLDAEGQPVWSPDGRRIAFFVAQQGKSNFVVKPASIDGAQDLVLTMTQIAKLEDWSPDGRTLLYSRPNGTAAGAQELWLLPLDGDRMPHPFLQTGFRVVNGQFSPDGRWIAYESNDSGRSEIYAQPFPGPGERVQISTTGGAQVRWRRDGRELFYVALDSRLTAVSVKFSPDGRTLDVGTATPLFNTRIPTGIVQGGGNKQQYVVTENGQRFLVSTAAEEAPGQINLILNWAPKRAQP